MESGPCRGRPFAGTSSSHIADQLLKEAAARNERTTRVTGRAFELLVAPIKPFVPERLRMLLRETDRPEQRVPPPLESPPSPPPAPVIAAAVERSARSEERPPPAKKRRHRTSKGAKGKDNPPELVPEKRERKEDEEVASTSTAAPAAAAAPPVTPLAATAAAVSSTVVGSTGSVIISPGQPPQSGDAMKTWEQELAASAKKNGGLLPPPLVEASPSTSATTPATPSDTDASAKKKRRSRNDPYYLNTCARTRPFQFDKEDKAAGKGRTPLKGIPEKRSPSKPPATPTAAAANQTAGPSVTTTVAFPPYSTPTGRRNSTDELASFDFTPESGKTPVAAAGAAGYSGGGGMKPATPTSVQVKKAQATVNPPRAPHSRYYVNNSGVSMTPPGPSSAVRPSIIGGIGGRSGSLGSQQLHGTTSGFQFVSQKASASNSSSSINSTGGGSMGSGIGASSSSSSVLSADPAHPVNAPPPESAGHDYGINYTSALAINQGSSNGGYLNPIGGPLRLASRVQGRDPWSTPLIRSPGVATSPHHHPPNGLIPIPPLQRAGSMSSMRPRLGSRGAPAAAPAAGVAAPTGGPVTDAAVQAIVHNIQMETAQKECANGKRASVLPNGALHHQSASSMPTMQPLQQPAHPYSVCRPSTSSDASSSSAMMTSGMAHHPLAPQSVPPPRQPPGLTAPSIVTTVCSTIPSSSRLSYGPSSSSGLFRGGPSTSSAAPLPPIIPPAAAPPQPPGDPSVLTFVRDALLAIQAEQQAGGTTMADRLNSVLANAVIVDTPEQQQHLQQMQQQAPAAAAAAAPPRPPAQTQRQYVLQPQGIGYAEYQPDNPTSYKSFATDGSLVQYGVSAEELYDQGVLARPSTSGMGGGGSGTGGGGGMRRTSQPPQPPPLANPILQQAQATAAHLGIPSSFSIPSTAGGGHDNGQIPSTSRELQQPPDAAAAAAASSSSSDKDILEKSCRELR